MLKRFFISMLGTVAGVFLSGVLAVFVILGVIGVVAGKSLSSSSGLEKNSILHLKLDGELTERLTTPTLMDIVQGNVGGTIALDELRSALEKAAGDSKIEGVYIDCGSFAGGVAGCEELAAYIREFKEKSGKWVYAYSDSYSQGAYMVATTADSLFVNPMGEVDVHGAASLTPFFKDLLDKVGVSMQIIKVGTYKSAVEPFILNEMSEPARRQQQEYIDSIWNFMAGAIAQGRDIEVSTVKMWADSMCSTWKLDRTIADGLADAAVYRRLMEQRLRRLTDRADDENLRLVSPAEYLAAAGNPFDAVDKSGKPHVALLYAVGDIVDSGKGGIVGEEMVPEIIALADDDNVEGMVMRVNSGGGSAFASEQIWEALEYFKSKGKPLYVSMGDYAASGGYYISCGADCIYADATTLTGSIGVFGMIPEASKLLNDKLGVHFTTVQSNPNASFPVVFNPMTPAQHAAMQNGVDNIYSIFTQRVADGRDLPVDSVRSIAEGRVWVGTSALRLGLVDKIGGVKDAIAAIIADNNLPDEVVAYPRDDENKWMAILRESKALEEMKAMAGYSPLERKAMEIARNLMEQNPMQARMPMTIIR
ncbi:MAG: signal peptide peptidase SppA [Muribaculaceae bacterium]|nr:signal peptide peptidase SppA [Muribaculaceae bacterium]